MVHDPEVPRGGYTAALYVDVLKDQLPTIYKLGLWFMQDNTSIHKARVIREWFEEYGIQLIL